MSTPWCSAPLKELRTKSWIGDQHRGDELRVLADRILGRHMGDQQPGMTVDQEHVFDLVDQRMLEHDLGEGRSRTPSLPAPFESSPGEAVFQRLVERWNVSSMVSPIDLRIAGTIVG